MQVIKMLKKIYEIMYVRYRSITYYFGSKIIKKTYANLPESKKTNKMKIFILMDRIDAAGDNAEAMYHYLKNKKDCKVYYVISRWSKDWRKMHSDKHVLDLYGFRYAWIYHKADVVLYSYHLYVPRYIKLDFSKIPIKQVFLQHGMLHSDISALYNASKGYDLFCASTKAEYEDFITEKYGFTSEQVPVTGLPRFDCLNKRPQNIITIGFTWRLYLKNKSVEEYIDSLYNKMIENLIVNPELIDLAEKYGYKVQYVPHPEIDKNYIQYLLKKSDKRVKVITDAKYKDIISETSLLITDHSSIAFDTAYLFSPVIYYQEDIEEFYSGKHSYTEGYFNYERDAFGEVIFDSKKLLNIVKEYLENGCEMKTIYKDRVYSTFEFLDNKNCERVYKAIKERLL